MAFSSVTITGTYETPDGNPADGEVVFEPTTAMRNGSTIVSGSQRYRLVNGQFPVGSVVAATSDPGTSPAGASYRVTEFIEGARREYYIEVPSSPTVLDLGSVVTGEVAPTVSTYQLLSGKGQPSGYASLGEDGKVPAEQLPSGQAPSDHGSLTGLSDDDHPQYLTASRGDALYAPLGTSGVTDHGALTGLTDDDHTLYHTDARGDLRYYTKTESDSALGAKAGTEHTHDAVYYTESETDAFLAGKAASVHGHVQADVSGLDTALAGKSDTGHTHVVSDVADLTTQLSDLTDADAALDDRVSRLDGPTVVLTDAATVAIDASLGKSFKVTLGGNRVHGNPSGAYDGQTLVITVAQDAVGGRAPTLGSGYRLAAGTTLTWSTGPNVKDKLGVQYDLADGKFDVIAFIPGFGA